MDELLERRLRTVLARIAPTQREAAARIGLEPTKLSKSLNGTRRLTAQELTTLAEVGEVSVDWLAHGSGLPPATATAVTVEQDLASDDGDVEDRRRRQYLEAAWRLISQKGYHAVRVADIAQACGTSTGAVHYYFPGKQGVLEAAMRHCVEGAFARQSSDLRRVDDAYSRMLLLIDNQVPHGGQIDNEWSVWLQFWSESYLRPELRPIHHEFYERWRGTVIKIVERGIRQGVFREIDPEAVALRFTSLTDGLGIQVMTGAPNVSSARMRQVLVGFVDSELLATPCDVA